MDFIRLIKQRLALGYGIVVIGSPKDVNASAFSKHWCAELGSYPVTTITSDMSSENQRHEIVNTLDKIIRRKAFILFSSFDRDEIFNYQSTEEINPEIVSQCCLMDLHKFVCEADTYVVNWAQQPSEIRTELLTPIEEKLSRAMLDAGLNFQQQVALDPYIVDFLVESGDAKVVVEADGIQYHVPEQDAVRDTAIKEKFGYETLRFGGSKIHRYPNQCATEIIEYLQKIPKYQETKEFEDVDLIDESQWKAIRHGRGPARVVAPAGSGKTKVLINRIIHLLNSGVDPSGILCLAFNRAARDQLEERLDSLRVAVRGPSARSSYSVTVATFNALGLSILRDLGVGSRPLMGRDLDKAVYKAFRQANIQLPPLRGVNHWQSYLTAMAKVKRGLIPESEVNVEFEQAKGKPMFEYPITPILQNFHSITKNMNQVTFDDQIYQAVAFLLANSVERHKLQHRFSHVIVDEYQDLNPAQIALVRIIAANNHDVFAVGDDDQLIYSWRQVSPNNIILFNQLFTGMSDYHLQINYRSSKIIVKNSQRLIRRNQIRVEKKIQAYEANPDGTFKLASGRNLSEQLGELSSWIKNLSLNNGAKWSDFAILTRYRASQLLVAHTLDKHNIPRTQLTGVKLYSLRISLILSAYLEAILDTKNISGEIFKTIINEPNRFIPNKILEEFEDQPSALEYFRRIIQSFASEDAYRQELEIYNTESRKASVEKNENLTIVKPKPPPDIELATKCKNLRDNWLQNNLKKFFAEIESYSLHIKNKGPANLILMILAQSDFRKKEEKDKSADEVTDEVLMDILMEEAKAFSTVHDFADYLRNGREAEQEKTDFSVKNEGGGKDDINAPISISNDSNEAEANEKTDTLRVDLNSGDNNRIQLSTIHMAKGREWKNVVLFDCYDETKVQGKSGRKFSDKNYEEERRVFYVGITRSIRNILCTFRNNAPSQYLVEAVVANRFMEKGNPKKAVVSYISTARRQISELQENLKLFETEQIKVQEFREKVIKCEQAIQNLDNQFSKLAATPTSSLVKRLFISGLSETQKTKQMDLIQDNLKRIESDKIETDREIKLIERSGHNKLIEETQIGIKQKQRNIKVASHMEREINILFKENP